MITETRIESCDSSLEISSRYISRETVKKYNAMKQEYKLGNLSPDELQELEQVMSEVSCSNYIAIHIY